MTNNCAHCGKPEKEHRLIDGNVRCVGISNSSFETKEDINTRYKLIRYRLETLMPGPETVESFLLDKLKDYKEPIT